MNAYERRYFDPERATDAPEIGELENQRCPESARAVRERAEDFHADDGGPFECNYE